MKKLYTLIVAVFLTVTTFAQAPEKMSYQAVVRDAANALVTNTQVGMQISILQGGDLANPGPTVLYSETQTPTTNANGLVSLEIGTGAIVSGIFANIDWSAGPYFIKTETDPLGGTNYTISGTSQLLSVPYALYAKNGLPTNGTEGQVLTINGSGDAEWIAASVGSMVYKDIDGDGFGDINNKVLANDIPTGYVSNNTDCDDNDVTINNANTVWYLDSDNDGYAALSVTQCNPGPGYTTTVLPLGDCNDGDRTINPMASEIAGDLIDNNCDGQIDEAEIGQFIAGGIVFWVDPTDNFHGLVCAITDQSTGIGWNNGSYMVTGALNTAIGTGAANTDVIIAVQGTIEINYAAGLARAYTGGGFKDWFLPSKDELNEMNTNKVIINTIATANGGEEFGVIEYWSSSEDTEYGSENAWYLGLEYGSGTYFLKDFPCSVRAVRAF